MSIQCTTHKGLVVVAGPLHNQWRQARETQLQELESSLEQLSREIGQTLTQILSLLFDFQRAKSRLRYNQSLLACSTMVQYNRYQYSYSVQLPPCVCLSDMVGLVTLTMKPTTMETGCIQDVDYHAPDFRQYGSSDQPIPSGRLVGTRTVSVAICNIPVPETRFTR